MEDIDRYEDNIYVIKRKLSFLKRLHGNSHFEYRTGRFIVKIFTCRIQDVNPLNDDSILQHSIVDVLLYEIPKEFVDSTSYSVSVSISLERDIRFANYQPIKYKAFNSNGDEMPILHLCELIRYLHKLNKLSAFV